VTVSRAEVIDACRDAVEPMPTVLAMWEAGSTAFGRADEWSDLDLYVLAEDEAVDDVLSALEGALDSTAGIAAAHRAPEPTPHGHAQAFYRLTDAVPFLVVDLVVLRRSVPERFLERQLHGTPVVLFDRTGEIVATELDGDAHRAALEQRLTALRERFEVFQAFVTKEVRRGNAIGAIEAFHVLTMRPLVEVLGMRHVPERSSYGAHYAHLDYPRPAVDRLARLWYPAGVGSVEAHRAEAESWFYEVADDVADRLRGH